MLGCLLISSGLWVLPQLQARFSFKELFEKGHPARKEYEQFQWNFQQGPRLLVYFHGPQVFSGEFLKDAEKLGRSLRRIPRAGAVLSALDLVSPRIAGSHQILSRILRPEVLEDPEQLRNVLKASPFTTHWRGFLYDEALETLVMIVTPPLEDNDPKQSLGFIQEVTKQAQATAQQHDVEVHFGGDFFLHQEVRRLALETQVKLTGLTFLLETALIGWLFGSFLAAFQTFFLLALSIYFSFVVMALAGIPVTFLSTNLAMMVLVIGTADLIHILGRFASLRQMYGPLGAARRASEETQAPVFLTSITTFGCIVATAFTPLQVLKQLAISLAAGVMVAWCIAVVYGPLLYRRSGIQPDRGVFPILQSSLGPWLSKRGAVWVKKRSYRLLFGAGLFVFVVLASFQTIDSNWFRYFGNETPVGRGLSFLERIGFPLSVVDYTLEVKEGLFPVLRNQALRRDVKKLTEKIESLPGVFSVEHMFKQLEYAEQEIRAVQFPENLAVVWQEARRKELLRQFALLGYFDRFFGAHTPRVRFVVLTRLESSSQFRELERQIAAGLRQVPFETLDPADLKITGQMHYWSAIVGTIPTTFAEGLLGCVGAIFLCFWAFTGDIRLGLLALVPNFVPLIVMFGGGRLFGIVMNENLCMAVSVALGIAVDDTLHVLHHYQKELQRTKCPERALEQAFLVAGAPIVVTSVLLLAGFSVCLSSSIAPVWQLGVLLSLSVSAALLGDLFVLPWVLLRFAKTASLRDERQYGLKDPLDRPLRRTFIPW